MSKQSEAKQSQGYRTDPQNCGNCKNRQCDKALPDWMRRENERSVRPVWSVESYGQESKQRCGLGGFAIRKTATCTRWEAA
jgi:hypothetical protein